MARDPFAGYDAWLERPFQEAQAAGERWEAACERYEESDAYWADFLAWMGLVALSEYDTSQPLSFFLTLYGESDEYRSKVEASDRDDEEDAAIAAYERRMDAAEVEWNERQP